MLSDKLEPFINLNISGILITPQVFCPWQYFQVHLMFVSFHFLISESDFIFFLKLLFSSDRIEEGGVI